MADIRLGSADNFYIQREADKDQWNNVFGEAGNDIIRLYNGTAIGGPGNDTFEKIIDPTNLGRTIDVAYWDSPAGVRVDLELGTAQDGFGGTDTLIGVSNVHASGNADWFKGDAKDNFFWGNGGADTMIGGAGIDGAGLNWFQPAGGGAGRNVRLADLSIVVSPDGLNAVVKPANGSGFLYTLTDIEYIQTEESPNNWVRSNLADFITAQSMAEQAIAAGAGLRWNAALALGSNVNLSFSFVTATPASGVGATGFRAFTGAEQQAVRNILAQAAAVAGITFTEVAEAGASVGQLRFGVSQQAATKGVSWLPGQAGAGDQSGDVWMDVESILALAPGSEGYQALLHEIGHALGLRHARNTDPGDAWAMQLRVQDDRSAFSVMSGLASADGLFRSTWGPLDVLALRYLYGSRSVNAGNTSYTLGSVEANAQTTLTDDGGIDTLDASAYATGVSLNLKPGGLSSVGLTTVGLAGVDNLALTATALIEAAIGSPYDDVLLGNDLDNTLTGGLGNDAIDGGAGLDTASFAGPRSAYEISNAYGTLYVEARDGVSGFDALVRIERLAFADQTVVLAASPLSADSSFSVDEDAVLNTTLPDPSDVARSEVSYSLVGNAAHGVASVSAAGGLSYTPAANYWGSDRFTVQLTSSAGANQYVVYVNVRPVNDGAPQAANASFIVPNSGLFSAQLPVASDVDGDAITYSLGTDPSRGAATVSASGAFTYQPNNATFGDDVFSYVVNDGQGGSNSYTLTVREGVVTNEDTPLLQLLPDPPTGLRSAASYALATAAGHGTATVSATGQLSFTPAANYFGSDSFAYNLTVAAVTTRVNVPIRVNSVDDGPPVAANALISTSEDTAYNGALPVATDPDGTAVVYSLASAPAHGTASVGANGLLSFIPVANYFGADSFSYTVTDADGGHNSYSVSVNVIAVNDAPISANASANATEDTPLSASLPAATDVEGQTITYARSSNAAHGSVVVNANGSYTYTPAANYFGPDSFGFSVSDGAGGSNTYTLTLSVAAVNDAPLASAGSASTSEDTPLNATLPVASDVDGDALSYSRSSNAAHGNVVVNANGSYTYTPAANYFGPDAFGYSVSDGQGGSASATVTLNVASVNDLPVVASGSASINEDNVLNGNLPSASDVDGDALSYSRTSTPAHGTVVVNANGSYSYTPEANYAGPDAFNFAVSDGKGGVANATLSLTVINVVDTLVGTAGADLMPAYAGGDRYNALGGNDTILPGAGDDTIDGGDGMDRVAYTGQLAPLIGDLATGSVKIGSETDTLLNVEALWGGSGADRLIGNSGANAFFGGPGNDSIDGAAGFDIVSVQGPNGAVVNLATGVATQAGNTDALSAIEAVFGSAAADVLTGLNGLDTALGEVFRPVGGNDSIDGGSGVDTVEFTGPRAAYSISRPSLASDALSVTHNAASGNEGTDALQGIERLLFTDRLVAFGARADELAKVVFVLWGAGAAGDKNLFAIGVNYYDTGVSYTTLIQAALSYWPQNDSALAAQLIGNVPGTSQTVAGLLAVMTAKGGGAAGQTEATRVMADDAANLANIDRQGLRSNGIEAALVVDGTVKFAALLAGINTAPVAPAGNAAGVEDSLLNATLPLASDADGDNLVYGLAAAAAHGTVVVNANGSYRYTPVTNFNGSDSFSYLVSDGQGGNTQATITLNVAAVNDAPTASPGSASLNEDSPYNGNLPLGQDIDGDALIYSRSSTAAHGSVAVNANGSFSYTPEANYSGSDSFEYTVSDGKGGSASALMNLTITSVVDVFNGTPGPDAMPGYPGADRYQGGAGNDTITPGLGDDSIDGGDGLDRVSYTERTAAINANLALGRVTIGSETDGLSNIEAVWGGSGNDSLTGDALNNAFYGGPGNDTLDGAQGMDLASYVSGPAVNANLLTGLATQGSDTDQLISIEVLIGSAFADTFTGLDGPANALGEVFRPGGGNDSVNGGTGVDRVEFAGPRSAYSISRPSLGNDALTVSHLITGGDGTDSLSGVERLLFSDRLVAFGSRAEELAKVAFVLWGAAASDRNLFAVGFNYYDSGVTYGALINAALSYWTHLDNAALAQRLVTDAPGTAHTAAELLALMNGFVDPGLGRATATQLMADDPANLANIDLMGLRSNGIEAALIIDGAAVWGPWPGG